MTATGVIKSVIVLVLAWTTFAIAAQGGDENPSFTFTEASTTKEKVADIDYQSRKVTLKNEAGSVRVVKVGNDINNLNRVKIGDEVTIETYQTISATVQPGPGDTQNIGSESQTGPMPGEKPSGIRTIEGILKTKIEAIDYDKRTVSFKNRNTVLTTYKIGPEAKRFDEIRRGDMLVVEYSQTIKLSVK
jgi:hypothetical protein